MAKKPKAPELRQHEAEIFAAAYMEHRTATAAMQAIKPHLTLGSAKTQGSLMLAMPEVKDALQAFRREMISTTILNVEEGQQLLTSIARGERQQGAMYPPTAAERIAACKLIGIWNGWENQDAKPKEANELGSLVARIRQARAKTQEIVQDAEFTEQTPAA